MLACGLRRTEFNFRGQSSGQMDPLYSAKIEFCTSEPFRCGRRPLGPATRAECYATRAAVWSRERLTRQGMPNRLRAPPCETAAPGSAVAATGRGGKDSGAVRLTAEDRRGSARAMVTNGRRKRWATFAKSSAVPSNKGWAASNSAAAAGESISAATTRCSSTRTAK